MKRLSRLLSVLILASMLLGLLPLTALAAEGYSFSGTVGEYAMFVFFDDREDFVESTEHSGNVPGMKIVCPSDGKAALAGTPTQAGTYVLEVEVHTQRAGSYNIVLTVTIENAPGDGTPVVTKNPTDEAVIETDSATFIARADNVRQYVWELVTVDGGTIPCKDLPSVFPQMKVYGANTDTLTLENIPMALDGTHVCCRFVGAEESVYSGYACITVKSLDDVKPEITKHPTGETVEEGDSAVFVAKAKYAKQQFWVITSPDGKTSYECKDAHKYFAGLKVSGSTEERLTLENIPLELNGWMVQCKFVGGAGTVVTNAAVITVNQEPTEAPTEETTEPTEEPTEEVTEAPTEAPAEAPTEAPTEVPAQDELPAASEPGQGGQKEEKSGVSVGVVILVAILALGIGAGAAVAVVVLKNKRG